MDHEIWPVRGVPTVESWGMRCDFKTEARRCWMGIQRWGVHLACVDDRTASQISPVSLEIDGSQAPKAGRTQGRGRHGPMTPVWT